MNIKFKESTYSYLLNEANSIGTTIPKLVTVIIEQHINNVIHHGEENERRYICEVISQYNEDKTNK